MRIIEIYGNNKDTLAEDHSGGKFFTGEFLGTINYERYADFIVLNELIEKKEGFVLGDIKVFEIAEDYWNHGEHWTYVNKEQNRSCLALERFLNDDFSKPSLREGKSPHQVLRKRELPVYQSTCRPITDRLTAIEPDVFRELWAARHSGFYQSMFALEKENKRLREEIEHLKAKQYVK